MDREHSIIGMPFDSTDRLSSLFRADLRRASFVGCGHGAAVPHPQFPRPAGWLIDFVPRRA